MRKIAALALTAALLGASGCADIEENAPSVIVVTGGSTPEITEKTESFTQEAPAETESFTQEAPAETETIIPPEKSSCEYEQFFREDKVHEMNIEINPADWAAVLENPLDKEYYHVNVTIDGAVLEDVGIHTRGVTSLQIAADDGRGRLPLKLKFDKYVKGRKFMGLDELALDNSVCDPSYLRQYSGYEIYRLMGVPVPFVTFFNVSLNGKPHAFYVGIEKVDDSFLKRAFGTKKNNLYKAEFDANLSPNMSFYSLEQKKGGDESRADLQRLIEAIDNTPLGEKGEISQYIDTDLLLRIFATDVVIHNWDGYAGETCHNYYLYDTEGGFKMIPWDMDATFLQTQGGELEGPGSREDILTPVMGRTSEDYRPLVKKLLAVEEYYEQYLDYIVQAKMLMEQLAQERLPQLSELIIDSIINDPTRIYSQNAVNRQWNKEDKTGLFGFIEDRIQFLNIRIPEVRGKKQDSAP